MRFHGMLTDVKSRRSLTLYKEEEFLQLSGIQHFAFCRRQWALAYIEMQWQENVRTVEGKILHENAHDPSIKEKRGDLLIVRAMSVHSREMGVSGECDVVEFHKTKDGISIAGREGNYSVVPVEYKRGKVAKECTNYGQRVQNSVFECQMDATKCRQVKDILEKIIDKEVDSLRFYYLGNNYKNKVEHIGAHPGFDVTGTLIL